MKIMAVICEYNPFHNGHAYQLRRQKEELGCDAIICLMSGHFVQRGEPAICDKWARAEMAVSCGCDLVLELPVVYALRSAEGFAEGAVSLLAALGIEGHLAFGSETADATVLSSLAELTLHESFHKRLQEMLAEGLGYPQACQEATEALLGSRAAAVLRNPNDLLGVSYIKAIQKTKAKLVPAVVRREKGQHDSLVAESEFLSATGIRNAIFENEEFAGYMPEEAYNIFRREVQEGRAPVSKEAVSSLLSYAIMKTEATELAHISGISEGLEMRLKQAAAGSRGFAELTERVKTKRYPLTRINRACMNILLGITKEDAVLPPAYGRILALGQKGREIIRFLQNKTSVPFITKSALASLQTEEAKRMFALDLLATDVYTLLYPDAEKGKSGLDFYRSPIVKK
ncbi:MAG: nucleotidyltransferase [Clostridia bacterium]|nr:nucleotidyltransferase [Clostridia bacterium]